MTKGKVIHTRYIIELHHEGSEYHLTVSSDLKDIFDIDHMTGDKSHSIIELTDTLWELFMKGELKLH